MNILEIFIQKNGLNPVSAMNFLQAGGIISDNCETAADVAIADFAPAIEALCRKYRLPLPAEVELF